MLSDADTERLTGGRWKRWDNFEKAIKDTHHALGCWGPKYKMSNFTFIICGQNPDKIYLLHYNKLTLEDEKKLQEGLDFDVERINDNVSRLVWFTKM
jgi:hypothetical protein